MEAVHRYEGTVNQVMGDGIMALFGAPLAHEDHAVRACYAAPRHAGARCGATPRRSGTPTASRSRSASGLNSGEVVVRAIGSDLRMDYTAVGQTTHLAARMEQLATPGTIRLTADTLRLAEGYIEVKPLGPMPVKGLDDAHRGLRDDRRRARVGPGCTRRPRGGSPASSGGTPSSRRSARRSPAPRRATVRSWPSSGSPGVGKSRLVWEVTHSHRVHGWLVLQAGSVSYGKATSYLPVIDLLKGYFAIEDRDEPARGAREGDGQALDAGPGAGGQPAGAPVAARRADR